MESYTKRWISSFFTVAVIASVFFILPPELKISHTPENKFVNPDSEISVVNVQKSIKKTEAIQKTENNAPVKKETVNEEVNAINKEQKKTEEIKTEEANSKDSEAAEAVAETENKTGELSASYKAYALSRIASKKYYPLSARTQGIEGKVKLHVIIDKEGKLALLEIINPSDSEILNTAALDAVKKSVPFKKIKGEIDQVDLKFTMDFSLDK